MIDETLLSNIQRYLCNKIREKKVIPFFRSLDEQVKKLYPRQETFSDHIRTGAENPERVIRAPKISVADAFVVCEIVHKLGYSSIESFFNEQLHQQYFKKGTLSYTADIEKPSMQEVKSEDTLGEKKLEQIATDISCIKEQILKLQARKYTRKINCVTDRIIELNMMYSFLYRFFLWHYNPLYQYPVLSRREYLQKLIISADDEKNIIWISDNEETLNELINLHKCERQYGVTPFTMYLHCKLLIKGFADSSHPSPHLNTLISMLIKRDSCNTVILCSVFIVNLFLLSQLKRIVSAIQKQLSAPNPQAFMFLWFYESKETYNKVNEEIKKTEEALTICFEKAIQLSEIPQAMLSLCESSFLLLNYNSVPLLLSDLTRMRTVCENYRASFRQMV